MTRRLRGLTRHSSVEGEKWSEPNSSLTANSIRLHLPMDPEEIAWKALLHTSFQFQPNTHKLKDEGSRKDENGIIGGMYKTALNLFKEKSKIGDVGYKTCKGECQKPNILLGPLSPFPGKASLMEYFQAGLYGGAFDSSRTAIVDGTQTMNFLELDLASTELALAIKEILDKKNFRINNPDGDAVIGICLPHSAKLIVSLFAILKLGAAYLPFDPTFPEDRVTHICQTTRPIAVFTELALLDKFNASKELTYIHDIGRLFPSLDNYEEAAKNVNSLKELDILRTSTPFNERIATILFTSGSTGTPKGVRLSHQTVMNRLSWQWKEFPYQVDEKLCFKTALTFIDSMSEIFAPLLRGLSTFIYTKATVANPLNFIIKINEDQVTRIILVPSLLQAIFQTMEVIGMDKGRNMLKSVLYWISSGEALLKPMLIEFFEKMPKGTAVANYYGSTEIMGDISYDIFRNDTEIALKLENKLVPLGFPLYNNVIYILHPTLEIVPAGKSGEIYIAGYNLCSGYVGLQNSDKFIANPFSDSSGFNVLYKTGDFGHIGIQKNGARALYYDGRIDSQLKVRGQRIDLNEIHQVIIKFDMVDKVSVLCYHPGEIDQTIVASIVPNKLIVPKNELKEVKGKIEALMKLKLRQYEIPEVVILESLPYLVNGKVDRQKLLTNYASFRQTEKPFEEWHKLDLPERYIDRAKIFIKILSEISGVKMALISENLSESFFEFGGNSLNSILIILKLREKNLYIKISDFVNMKSMKDIIMKLEYIKDPKEKIQFTQRNSLYSSEPLNDDLKPDVIKVIASSFSKKGDLEQWTSATYNEFADMISSIWDPLVEKKFSFVIRRNADQQIVAACCNFDVYDEPQSMVVSKGIAYALEFLEQIEGPQRERLPYKNVGELMHAFMLGTMPELKQSENVTLVEFMESENVRLAKQFGFKGIFTVNTSPLTIQIGKSIQGYVDLQTVQVNKFVSSDGTMPFCLAPNNQVASCCWKPLALDGKRDVMQIREGI